MADETTYLIRAAAWLAQALGRGAETFVEFEPSGFGVALPASVLTAPDVTKAARRAAAAAEKVHDAGKKLETVAAAKQESEILLALLALGAALAELFAVLRELVEAVSRQVQMASFPTEEARQAAARFAADLARTVADYAITSALTEFLPELGFALRLLGLLEWKYVPFDPDDPQSREHVVKRLMLDRAGKLVTEPAQHFHDTLGWGKTEFDPTDLFNLAADFFPDDPSVDVGVESGEPYLQRRIRVRRDRSGAPARKPGLLFEYETELSGKLERRFPVSEAWHFGLSSDLTVSGDLSVSLRPPFDFSIVPTSGVTIAGDLRAFFERNEKKRPFDIVGGTGLVSLTAHNLGAGVGIAAKWNGSQATVDPLLFAKLDKLTLKLGADKADSFVGSLLSKADIQGSFDLGLEWAFSTGLKITASGGIEIALPIHKQLGPIEFATLYIALRIQKDGALSLELSTAIIGTLGPLSASVDRIGAGLDLKFAKEAGGKQGMFDVDLHFKPPNGIGIAVDAGVVKGGGYLFIDVERGEYAGALELTIAKFISVKAIGLINTKLPDGSDGFSLLIIITAEFGSGIQLGFGFTLLGVGGLLGVNRGVNMQPLLEGVRTGAVDRIMFPQNIVKNAPKIISDLRSYFPAEPGTFLIGPMAKIGWGTPTLISVALGVIIEIPPGNIIILGVLKVVLPTEEAAILKLQVNFIGAIEFDKKRVYFFAALFDSRVVFLTIEGEMGLLVAFGDDANFVVSVGGFHPVFQPPPLPFPVPKRVAVSLIDTDYARVRIEGYFAVTSNTVQFGAAVEVYFGFSAINVSGHLAFDALFQFSPFYFIITITASFALNAFGISLLSINIRGTLEGPTPWRVTGTASVRILFFDINVDVEVIWGEEKREVLPPIEVLPLVKAELEKKENWRAVLPASNNLLVSLRKLPEDGELVLHPVGTLRIAQRAVPLELTLAKVGNKKPSDVNRMSVIATAGGGLGARDAYEQFAPAQYQDFSDSEKLSRPAYAPERGGVELYAKDGEMKSNRMVRRIVRSEEIVIDSKRRTAERFKTTDAPLFEHFAGGAAITRSELSESTRSKLDPFDEKIETEAERYAVVFQSNNKAFRADAVSFRSEASAREYLEQQIGQDPNLGEQLHVIPAVEKAA